MADKKENPFKAMMAARQGEGEREEETPVDEETKPAAKPKAKPAARRSRSKAKAKPEPVEEATVEAPVKRGRGRPPSNGKRANDEWIGRTYYVKRDADIRTELELASLRFQGIEMDKSDLVNALLEAWVKYRQGENGEDLLSEISPRKN